MSYYGDTDSYAYQAAIARNIRNNAAKSRPAKIAAWFAEDSSREALIESAGNSKNDFARKMVDSFHEYGRLSEKQESALRNAIERDSARKVEFAAKRIEEGKNSDFVGVVGERLILSFEISFIKPLMTQFGESFLHICKDSKGNQIVYIGSKSLGSKGDSVNVKATIKKHDIREGVKQTVINRPTLVNQPQAYYEGPNAPLYTEPFGC